MPTCMFRRRCATAMARVAPNDSPTSRTCRPLRAEAEISAAHEAVNSSKLALESSPSQCVMQASSKLVDSSGYCIKGVESDPSIPGKKYSIGMASSAPVPRQPPGSAKPSTSSGFTKRVGPAAIDMRGRLRGNCFGTRTE